LAEHGGEDDGGEAADEDAQRGAEPAGCRGQLAPEEAEEGHRPRIVTTAVVPMRNGREGSRSSSRIRPGERLASRTQLRVLGTRGRMPAGPASSGRFAHPIPWTVPRKRRPG